MALTQICTLTSSQMQSFRHPLQTGLVKTVRNAILIIRPTKLLDKMKDQEAASVRTSNFSIPNISFCSKCHLSGAPTCILRVMRETYYKFCFFCALVTLSH